MATVSIRISKETHEAFKKAAAESDQSLSAVIDEAARALERQRFWIRSRESLKALKANPEAWRSYLAELEELDRAAVGDLDGDTGSWDE